jgi:metal-responsive CopG/Arc/MetJ family transcriptional regulator
MTTRVMISFPDEFLEAVDTLAEAEQRSRSELVREALRRYMEARTGRVRPGDRPEVQAAVTSLNALAQITPGTGEDSTTTIRDWRDTRR